MRTINLPSAVITAHESARTLPEYRRVEHDYYSLIDSGIGSTIQDFDARFEQMQLFVGSNDPDTQFEAWKNTRFLFYNLIEKQYSPRSLAFACLIDSVDGVQWTDYSPAGVEQLSRLLSEKGLNDELISQYWPELKKNSTLN